MKTSQTQPVCGLMRKHATPKTELNLGIDAPWTWEPKIEVDKENLVNVSPTREYDSSESN